jgi:hypothetical protein
MKNNRLDRALKIGTLLAIGLASRVNAKAQSAPMCTYYTTNEHCKFINNKSRVVINHSDTLQVYSIDTIYRLGQEMVVCDLGPGKDKLIFDPLYYINNPWLPPIQKGDTVAYKMARDDIDLAYLFYYYENMGDEKRRDSVETVMLKNRRALAERAAMNFQKQY